MPRLTDRDYLFFRTYLHEVWLTKRQAFSLISTRDQYYLHQYFRLSDELAKEDALAHRRAITTLQPSLPQCAGRALRHLARPKRTITCTGEKRIIVHPLLRPQPDVERLAKALLEQMTICRIAVTIEDTNKESRNGRKPRRTRTG